MRIGKILELMDFMSGRVCYKHLSVLGDHDFTCVTASVDNFEIYSHKYSVDQDIIVDAFLSYVGSRTMEIQCNLYNAKNEMQLSVKYLFVAVPKDKSNKSKKIPSLNLEKDIEPEKAQLFFIQGK